MQTWKKPKDLPLSHLMSRHFYCDVIVVLLVSRLCILLTIQCRDSAFGVATLHFSYVDHVATLSVDVATLL